uniref:Uncharacterized protein n=1 Tax=Megaviridae environmental sample TaxID=1737588 RepID=A0A5J6VJG2_9VIRU|nr:MAG: hypothetical protein [Megaviridae environmental sample]
MQRPQRLSNDTQYKRPERTYQQKLTEDDIKEKLADYERVEDITKIPINTHIRYFAYLQDDENPKKLKRAFRMGGFLKNKDNCEKYIILSNGSKSWSVNSEKSILYRKLKPNEIMDKNERKIRKKFEKEINQLKQQLSEKDNELTSLKSRISQMNV